MIDWRVPSVFVEWQSALSPVMLAGSVAFIVPVALTENCSVPL